MAAEALRLIVGLSITVGALTYARATVSPSSPWKFEACITNDCIAQTLNRLPSERANEAKLTTGGMVTYVWFRE